MSVFSGKKISIYLHVAGWIIVFLLPIFLSTGDRKPDAFFLGQIFIRTAIYGAIFYISYFWLIPQFLFRGKKLHYYLIMILVIVSMYFVNGAITWQLIKRSDFHREQFVDDENNTTANGNRRNNSKPPRYPWKFDLYNYLFTSMLVAGFSVGLKMSAKYNENEKRRKELEKEKLSSELAFLKNQVSPHFFFNTLNNIYSLTEINTKEAQNAILKLSKLMRYLLYESEKGDVKLSSEIAFITNYIQLMKLRISEKVNISVTFPDAYKDISFPPLIFIPFVENAFKHGVSYKDNSFIYIDLKITESNLEFMCKNSISGKTVDLSESGIGLENARKRLLLLFPKTHKLLIHQHDNIFEVNLTIQLESKI